MSCSRAKPAAAILPSMPRKPKPPGITMPSRSRRRPSASRPSVSSDAIQSISTCAPHVVAAVLQRLGHREVGVGQVDVLADEADAHRSVAASTRATRPRHSVEVGLVLVEVQHPAHVVVEALVVEHERDLVERRRRRRGDDALLGHVAELADLLLEPRRDRPVGAAHDRVGLDAPAAQLGDRVLRGLGLLLARRADERHQRDVHVEDVVAADVLAELPDRLEEREDLDVADGAADLGDHDVDVSSAASARMRSLISSVMCGITCTVSPR